MANLSLQIGLLVVIILSGIVFIASSFWRLSVIKDKSLRSYDIMDIISGVSLVVSSIVLYASYSNYIPADSKGCEIKPISYGMLNYGVDITGFEADTTKYPANTFTAAQQAYLTSKNGPQTGYFAWDGTVVEILKSTAYNLASDKTPAGNWMVFGDLNNVSLN